MKPKIERVLGVKLPISVGTAMIFESNTFDIRLWSNRLYVNLRTLYRNFVQSYSAADRTKLNEQQFLEDYLNEVAEFERLVLEQSSNRVKPYFYYPTYKSVPRYLPHTELKEYNPDGFDLVEQHLWEYVKRHGLMTPFNYEVIDTELPQVNEPITLISSFVVDLLSANRFPKVVLLESFTGKLKKREEWYTKINVYRGKKANDIKVPFNKFTIQVFGDKSGALKGSHISIRNAVREMAEKDHWSPVTSNDKIRYSISKIKDSKLKDLLLKYL